jgi:hypothetical protein
MKISIFFFKPLEGMLVFEDAGCRGWRVSRCSSRENGERDLKNKQSTHTQDSE